MENAIFEDDLCPECCDGKMERFVENCSCHLNAPCSPCENAILKCSDCGFEIEYDNEGYDNGKSTTKK